MQEAKTSKRLVVIRPICELQGRTERLEAVLGTALAELEQEGVSLLLIEKVSELERISLCGERVLFAVPLSEAGVNLEYYRLLEYFRTHPHGLDAAVAGILVDGSSELFTKALARRLAFSANAAGCTLPGKPLVEATGSLANFHVLSRLRGQPPLAVYQDQVRELLRKLLTFSCPVPADRPLRLLAVHASSRATSNSLLLWDRVRQRLTAPGQAPTDIREISLENGEVVDCRGCRFEDCRHFGERGSCFYGGIMVEQVYPAILACDALLLIGPNYNDALSANLTAFINRLTALFTTHDFSAKRIYALVVSGYSGGDIVAEQILGAFTFNKSFLLPPRFALLATANDPGSVLALPDIDARIDRFADELLMRSPC